MEFTNPFETSFTEKFIVIGAGDASLPSDSGRRPRAVTPPHVPLPHLSSHPSVATATTAGPSDLQPRTLGRPGNAPAAGAAANFSYPRPEGGSRLSRHESNDSWSSVASSSVPGMVMDSSDSEVSSLDDDYCQYNVSANELWDSFWPSANDDDGTRGKAEESRRSQETTAAAAKQSSSSSSLRPFRPTQEYFSCDLINHYTDDADDDTITIPPFGDKPSAVTTPATTTTATTTPTGTGEETTQRRRSRERDPQTQSQQPSPRSSPRRRASTKRAPATYSVYPKPQLPPPQLQLPRLPLPPRTSSLGPSQLPKPASSSSLPVFPAPPSSKPSSSSLSSLVGPRQRRLRGSKSTHNLLLHLTPSSFSSSSSSPPSPPRPSTAGKTAARSVPVSPAYPPPPPPRALRPSVSAANLREEISGSETTRHNVTAPLPPLAPSPAIIPSEPLVPPPQPAPPASEQQRFVSVFELDSDAESIAETGSGSGNGGGAGFAKRFMSRSGLHKKEKGAGSGGAGGKRRGSAPTTGTGASSSSHGGVAGPNSPTVVVEFPDPGGFPAMVPPVGVTREPSPRRNRGGSLGRILGLKGR